MRGAALALLILASCTPDVPPTTVGSEVYAATCATCHGPDGQGVNEAFPPLAASPWVNLPDSLLIRMVLRGLRGPIRVGDSEYNNVMPPHSFLSDEQIAAVLTFVRGEFGVADSVSADQVSTERIRHGTGAMWTIGELTGGDVER